MIVSINLRDACTNGKQIAKDVIKLEFIDRCFVNLEKSNFITTINSEMVILK